MSPSRAQHVLWICDAALCTYTRCSHDSKSSPQPPSAICLESRNWQARATSLHAALQRWGRESDGAGGRGEFAPTCPSQLGARLYHAHSVGLPKSFRLWQQVPWSYHRHKIWEEELLGQPGDQLSPTTWSCPCPRERGTGSILPLTHPSRYVCCIQANASRPNQVP